MGTPEELHESLLEARRELARLKTEARDANLLIGALNALLVYSGDDPFADVFSVIGSVFDFTHAIVLAEQDYDENMLICEIARPADLIGSRWRAGRFFRKVLAGRVTATLSDHDLEEWQQFDRKPLRAQQPALYMPIRVRERRGMMILFRAVGSEGFDRHDIALARKFMTLASHAFAATHAHQQKLETEALRALTRQLQESRHALLHRANHDHLTELPNGRYMRELVEQRIRCFGHGQSFALAFVGLDDLKTINDLHSHAIGDALLAAMAERLRLNLRASDIVGRLGGDEFVILLDGFRHREDIRMIAERLLARLKEPFTIGPLEVVGSASIGLAFYPEHGRDYESLRRNADTAMCMAKVQGKGNLRVFDEAMGKAVADRIMLESEVRAAVKARRFRCALQPKVDLRARRTVGFEALARMIGTDGHIHGPDTFIPLAHECGLLDEITRLILEDALQALPCLDRIFGEDMIIGINISAAQASDPAFMASFADLLACSGKAERFIVEVTEDAFIAVSVFQRDILPLLKAIGSKVSIDDFGTGYSPLSALIDITADELKVDRSFISRIHKKPRSQSILKAIESLGQTLGMSIVAEGIEIEAELQYILDKTSIRLAQGYYFSKPCFVEALTGMEEVKFR